MLDLSLFFLRSTLSLFLFLFIGQLDFGKIKILKLDGFRIPIYQRLRELCQEVIAIDITSLIISSNGLAPIPSQFLLKRIQSKDRSKPILYLLASIFNVQTFRKVRIREGNSMVFQVLPLILVIIIILFLIPFLGALSLARFTSSSSCFMSSSFTPSYSLMLSSS